MEQFPSVKLFPEISTENKHLFHQLEDGGLK